MRTSTARSERPLRVRLRERLCRLDLPPPRLTKCIFGRRTFVAAPSTPGGKTVLRGFAPLTLVGVRVGMTNSEGTGAWSHVESILVER